MNTTAKPKGKKERRCCIDLGSSYFRMLSVDVETGRDGTGVSDIFQERMYVGWGEEITSTGSISREAAGRAADALEILAEKIVGRRDLRLTAVSTSALRLAANRDEIRDYLKERTGVEIDMLSERGEAFLGFAGASLDLRTGEPAILADAGGTSTELSWGAAPAATSFLSVPVGTHTVRAAAGVNPRLISSRMTSMLKDAGIPSGDSPLPGTEESPTIMLTGGTAVSLASVWKHMQVEGYDGLTPVEMSAGDMALAGRRLTALFHSGRERMIPLPHERIRLLLPGLAIIKGIVNALHAEKIRITARDLRWGVVLGDGTMERGYLADEQESPDSR